MRRPFSTLLAGLFALGVAPAQAITLDQAMAHPDWIGHAVETPFWSIDGGSIYYRLKREGSTVKDLRRIGADGGNDVVVDPTAMADADAADAVFDRTRQRAVFVRNGDIFLRDVASGRLSQLTRTPAVESQPQFSADGRAVHYRNGNDWHVHDIASAVSGPAAVLKTEKDPDAKKPDDLAEMQLRLFSTLRTLKADREAKKADAEAFQKGDPTRAPLPFFLGDDITIEDTSLSPDGRRMLVVTTAKGFDTGKVAKLQRYVTESGYEEQEDERVRVGRNLPAPQTLWMLDLAAHTHDKVAVSALPGITDDPLKKIREESAAARAKDDEPATKADDDKAGRKDAKRDAKAKADTPAERALTIPRIAWGSDGRNVAVQLRAIDNKDRWIASIDFAAKKFVGEHRLTDPAWINWGFNEFGWSPDGQVLWYLSEESGYSHLYAKRPGQKAKALTRGSFEVSDPQLSGDGTRVYVRANAEAPYAYDVYRVALAGGELERITHARTIDAFELSPDGRRLALLQSSSYVPQQLAVQAVDAREPRLLTDTRTAAYKALAWPKLEIVGVPSRHTQLPVWSKLYKPANFDASKKYPAVLFVHGAGYLQNTKLGYPNYFREQMFHNLLTEQGYVVLDMDFRASEGYGRDWRTAIYRQMGTPELEDLIAGVDWLVANHAVDAKRVGLYGGSYGGFMTLMAMFKAPEVFAAGAALRPVTDWTSYNHEYTSNILNTPQDDVLAYRRSSPIEFADGLRGGLLIAHGMIDDNVLFQDSVRLYQRLVELRKNDFELAGYPLERHSFVHADAWYDEYRRIHVLFERHLKP
jgi:dipeptidyl aminopeptidase/acylaminoacyl peptidase